MLAAALGVALMFAATPFLIPELAERYGVSEGIAAGVSIAQVSAFALTTFAAPRYLRPSAGLLRSAAVALMIADVISAMPDRFWLLLVIRLIAGAAAGVVTWLVWTDAMRQPAHMEGVASAGSLAGLLGHP